METVVTDYYIITDFVHNLKHTENCEKECKFVCVYTYMCACRCA